MSRQCMRECAAGGPSFHHNLLDPLVPAAQKWPCRGIGPDHRRQNAAFVRTKVAMGQGSGRVQGEEHCSRQEHQTLEIRGWEVLSVQPACRTVTHMMLMLQRLPGHHLVLAEYGHYAQVLLRLRKERGRTLMYDLDRDGAEAHCQQGT